MSDWFLERKRYYYDKFAFLKSSLYIEKDWIGINDGFLESLGQ